MSVDPKHLPCWDCSLKSSSLLITFMMTSPNQRDNVSLIHLHVQHIIINIVVRVCLTWWL